MKKVPDPDPHHTGKKRRDFLDIQEKKRKKLTVLNGARLLGQAVQYNEIIEQDLSDIW